MGFAVLMALALSPAMAASQAEIGAWGGSSALESSSVMPADEHPFDDEQPFDNAQDTVCGEPAGAGLDDMHPAAIMAPPDKASVEPPAMAKAVLMSHPLEPVLLPPRIPVV